MSGTYKSIYFVGYETKKLPDLIEPKFEPRKGTTKPETIARQIEEKRQLFHERAASSPYTSFLSRIVALEYRADTKEIEPLLDTSQKPKGRGDVKTPPAVRFASLLSQWDYGVSRTLLRQVRNPVLFIGFDPKVFLKLLGTECAMLQEPIRCGWWVANSDHMNIQSLLLPDAASVDFNAACTYLGVATPKDFEPCQNAEDDARLCYEITERLGLLGSAAAVTEDELDEAEVL